MIRFKCSCGRELSAPDDSAGREVFCPGCRKSAPVPAPPDLDAKKAPVDEREASEFKPGALASLLGEPGGSGGQQGEILHEQKVEAGPAAPVEPEETRPPQEAAEKSAEREEPGDAPGKEKGRGKQESSKGAPGAGAAGEKPQVPPGEIKVQPAAETQDVPPPGVEVFPDKIKFRCECGQKVAVRLPAPRAAGKCPRCKRKLKVPEVPGAPAPAAEERPAAEKELRHCNKCGRRIEDANAAFCPRCGFPLSLTPPGPSGGSGKGPSSAPPSAPAKPAGAGPAAGKKIIELPEEIRKRAVRQAADSAADRLRPTRRSELSPAPGPADAPAVLGRRLGAFLLDGVALAAVAVGAYSLAGRLAVEAALIPATLVGLGVFWLVNDVVFAAMAGGRSLGMTVAGLEVVNSEGRPAGLALLLVRFLAVIILFFGAPLALLDARNRALHDIVCGTSVRRVPNA